MPPAAQDIRATSALAEYAGAPARSAFLRFVHLQCLRRTQKTVDLLAAAHSDPSPSAVHRLRVAARRLVYALDCFYTALAPNQAADFRKRIKSIHSAARPLRELDVALELVSEAGMSSECSLATALRLRRDAAATNLSERLERKRYQHLAQRCLNTAGDSATATERVKFEEISMSGKVSTRLPWMPDESCATNASRVLPLLAAQYFRQGRAVCAGGASQQVLHKFRLGGKRLRYCLEIFRDQYGPPLEARIDILRDIQRRLGVLSDCETTAGLLRSAGMPSDTGSEQLLTILGQRQDDTTESFLSDWHAHLGTLEVERDWTNYLALGELPSPGLEGGILHER